MSLSPVNLLTRLDELKKWQEKQQKRLMQQTRGRSESTGSDYDTIEGLSAFDSINFGIDKAKQSQEQTDKPKKAYLRRGAGLCRFGMNPGDQKRPFNKPIFKKDTTNRTVDVTPLNVPDYNIKATWQGVEQNRREAESDLVTQINEFAKADTTQQNVDVIVHKNMHDEAVASEQSLYEKALEKELLIFEALEQKAMHSSFSSTNSSVVRILSSTPNKTKPTVDKNEETLLKKTVHFEPKTLQLLQDRNYEKDTSPDSSIDSEDFDFKDTERWSDTVESSESSPSIVSIESSASTCVPKTTDKGTMTDNTKFNEELFRKEQKKMEKMKVQFEKEQREFKKEKKEFEKYVLEEKIKVEFYLEDEKKKLAKEKMVFERYVKDVNNKTTRKEREEISALKSELATVKEAAKLKDTRNATSQARLRNQVKTLEKENANLKDEVERLLKQNAKLQTAQKFSRKPTDTKMLHEINRNLSKLTKDAKVSEQLSKLGIMNSDEVIKKRQSPIIEDVEHDKSDDSLCENDKAPPKIRHSYEDYKSNGCKENATDTSLLRNYEMVFGNTKQENENVIPPSEVSYTNGKTKAQSKTKFAARNEATFSDRSPEVTHSNGKVTNGQTARNETTLSDGSTEVTYSNGNVKVVSPDGNFIVMKYFNGDIKETRLLDGVIRYYYSQNQSWHSTYADGSELLEFPNGQTEKKSKDGSSEIAFPNGIVKTITSDGTENISYPDGSRVTVDGRGEKILLLPNGQKEIHTDDHKRREYPDGTVKILYPDGIQETRYNNGRIRIKDKTGKLLLDSFDENT